MAVLSPPPGGVGRTVDEAIDGILELRRSRSLGEDLTVRDLLDAGRR